MFDIDKINISPKLCPTKDWQHHFSFHKYLKKIVKLLTYLIPAHSFDVRRCGLSWLFSIHQSFWNFISNCYLSDRQPLNLHFHIWHECMISEFEHLSLQPLYHYISYNIVHTYYATFENRLNVYNIYLYDD